MRRAGGAVAALTLVLAGLAALPAAADPQGQVTEFHAGLSSGFGPAGITPGPDGNLWFTENNNPVGSTSGKIGRITPDAPNTITEFHTGLSMGATPSGITAGPDGNLWFTEDNNPGGAIGRITPGAPNTITEFNTGLTTTSNPGPITLGPDGNLWFVEAGGSATAAIGGSPRRA
jgi:virginiamycin B lyase